jgi:hypothetical protein
MGQIRQIVFASYLDRVGASARATFKDVITLEGHIVLPASNPQKLAELTRSRRPDGVVIFSLGGEHFIEAVPEGMPVLYLYTARKPTPRPGLTAIQVPEDHNTLQRIADFVNGL